MAKQRIPIQAAMIKARATACQLARELTISYQTAANATGHHGSQSKPIRTETALLIANYLGYQLSEIDWPAELVNRGAYPQTHHCEDTVVAAICQLCRIELPIRYAQQKLSCCPDCV